MVKLRKQRKKKSFNTNVNRKRLRNRIQNTGSIQCQTIKNAWSRGKSIQNNLKDMGLAYDPNKVLKIPSYKETQKEKVVSMLKGDFVVTESQKVEPSLGSSKVINELISDAKAPRESKLRLPRAHIEYITYFMDKYGTDYKAMAKDRKNYYQDTWKQLRAKVKKFMSVPKQYAAYLRAKGQLGKDITDDDIKAEVEALQMDSD